MLYIYIYIYIISHNQATLNLFVNNSDAIMLEIGGEFWP